MGFSEDVNAMRDELVQKYNQKTLLVSDRETKRYMYIQGWLSQFESGIAFVFNQAATKYNDSSLNLLLSQCLTNLRASIPMADAGGRAVEGYFPPEAIQSGWNVRPGVNFLGEIDKWFVRMPIGTISSATESPERAFGPQTSAQSALSATDMRPMYIQNLQNIFSNSQTVFDAYYSRLPTNWVDIMNYLSTSYPLNGSPNKTGLAEKYLEIMGQQIEGMIGSFVAIVSDGKLQYDSVVKSTLEILKLQVEIDALENKINGYISVAMTTPSSTTSLEKSDVAQDMQMVKETLREQDQIQMKSGSATKGATTIDSSGAVPSDFAQNQLAPMLNQAAKSSSMPYLVLGALALFFLKGRE